MAKAFIIEPQSVPERSLAAKENHQPYPPSWVDRFNDWVERMPGPAWMFYLGFWLLLTIMGSGSKWLEGVEPYLKVRWI